MSPGVRILLTIVGVVGVASLCAGRPAYGQELSGVVLSSLPEPVTNNAVATVTVGPRQFVVSFNGLGAGKTYRDTRSSTYVLDVELGTWEEAAPVPGDVGRLASAAVAVGERAFVFGGYTVAEDGTEVSTPWVHAFDPIEGTYEARAPMPVPVDDMVTVVYQDRYVYLLSGWHDVGNVNLVQLYDTDEDRWVQATPIPGAAVFGHAGGIVGGSIVYCDGVAVRANAMRRRDFVAQAACFAGTIDPSDRRRIDWRTIDPHPGPPRYRMAASGVADRNGVLFVGGTDNPYNYDGIGYDGRPATPVAGGMLLDLETLSWRVLPQDTAPTMDHRALVPLAGGWATVGGMRGDRTVSADVVAFTIR